MGVSSFNLNSVLEKMGRSDLDYRFMAASDLLGELKKEHFKLDTSQEKKVGTALLKLLIDEISGDVQTQGQLCLGPFIKKASVNQTSFFIENLLQCLLTTKEAKFRDSSSYSLKTVLREMQSQASSLIITKLLPHIKEGLSESFGYEVKVEIVEILQVAIEQYGSCFSSPTTYQPLQAAVATELTSRRKNNRKRAAQCLASLAVFMEPADFSALISSLVQTANTSKSPETIRSTIQTIGSISRSAGFRFADSMEEVAPLVITCAKGEHLATTEGEGEEEEEEEDDELRENCFQTLESLVLRCPNTISPFIESITQLCLQYIQYDPNFNGDAMDEDMEMEEGFEDFEEWEDDEDVDYSDDEDVSWKVRKAASKTLCEVIRTKGDLLSVLCELISPVLVKCFREREETVKLDLFKTFSALLTSIKEACALGSAGAGPQAMLEKQMKEIICTLASLLAEKKALKSKVRIGVFVILKELLQCAPHSFAQHVEVLIPHIAEALHDSAASSNLKIETLQLTNLLFTLTGAELANSSVQSLTPPLCYCVTDGYYKIVAEALRTCSSMLPVLEGKEGSEEIAQAIYQVLLPKLKVQDIDQEVKEEAIYCSALLIAGLGSKLPELAECFEILKDRLANEITRLTAVKALELIACSPLKLDLSSILLPSVELLTNFLKLNNRQLKQASLKTLTVFFASQSQTLLVSSTRPVLENVAPLISEDDLHVTHLSLQVASAILRPFPAAAKIVKEILFPKVLVLLQSKVLQGHALEKLMELLKEILVTRTTGFGFTHLTKVIHQLLSKDVSKKCFPACAQCIGVLCANSSEKKRSNLLSTFVGQLQNESGEEQERMIALLCIGEIGNRIDFYGHTADIEKMVSAAFVDSSEEVKSAAAFSLGNLAVGNMAKTLPFILSELSEHEERRYLLLLSLREIIQRLADFPSRVSDFLSLLQKHCPNMLFEYCQSPKEGIRTVVAECVGRLASTRMEDILPHILRTLSSDSPYDRSTACSSIKFAITAKQESPLLQDFLKPKISLFLDLLNDSHVDVRRSALLVFNFLVHNHPSLMLDVLEVFIPKVYAETKENSDLLRKVKVGPFTHTVDDGLENRKAAFECMYTLMETCLSYVHVSSFIERLVSGLSDASADIKSMCHIMLEHLAVSSGPSLVLALDSVVEPLRTTLEKKPKDSAVKQDKERYEELVRSILRAVMAISKIPGYEGSSKFTDFVSQTIKSGEIGEKFAQLKLSRAADLMDTN